MSKHAQFVSIAKYIADDRSTSVLVIEGDWYIVFHPQTWKIMVDLQLSHHLIDCFDRFFVKFFVFVVKFVQISFIIDSRF